MPKFAAVQEIAALVNKALDALGEQKHGAVVLNPGTQKNAFFAGKVNIVLGVREDVTETSYKVGISNLTQGEEFRLVAVAVEEESSHPLRAFFRTSGIGQGYIPQLYYRNTEEDKQILADAVREYLVTGVIPPAATIENNGNSEAFMRALQSTCNQMNAQIAARNIEDATCLVGKHPDAIKSGEKRMLILLGTPQYNEQGQMVSARPKTPEPGFAPKHVLFDLVEGDTSLVRVTYPGSGVSSYTLDALPDAARHILTFLWDTDVDW